MDSVSIVLCSARPALSVTELKTGTGISCSCSATYQRPNGRLVLTSGPTLCSSLDRAQLSSLLFEVRRNLIFLGFRSCSSTLFGTMERGDSMGTPPGLVYNETCGMIKEQTSGTPVQVV